MQNLERFFEMFYELFPARFMTVTDALSVKLMPFPVKKCLPLEFESINCLYLGHQLKKRIAYVAFTDNRHKDKEALALFLLSENWGI